MSLQPVCCLQCMHVHAYHTVLSHTEHGGTPHQRICAVPVKETLASCVAGLMVVQASNPDPYALCQVCCRVLACGRSLYIQTSL